METPAPVTTSGPAETPAPVTTPEPEPEPAPASNLSYVIVDTGQDKCYDNSREITCPQFGGAFYGQDAQYQSIQPTYQDNGDSTVTDLNTGLMWQQDPGDKMPYQEAVANASSFNLAGYDDWRLPTIKELYSLILFSGTDPHASRAIRGTPVVVEGLRSIPYAMYGEIQNTVSMIS